MKEYILQETSERASTDIVWAFDLGKGSIGEAVRQGTTFLHKASLLIPADFAETKTAAKYRRAWRTRLAHKAREQWLEQIWQAAGLKVLRGRQVRRNADTGEWLAPVPGDERLEREFAKAGDDTCYTSCLLRIKLLRGEKLEQWQIYKALRSAIQKRGYGKIPWAEKEARRAGKSIEELEKEEQNKDANYLAALNRWRDFKIQIPADFHFPCYYDAWKMGLWNPKSPDKFSSQLKHEANSTRNVRFDREDVEKEIKALASKAEAQLNVLARCFEQIQRDGWTQIDPANASKKHFPVSAKTLGDFFCHGPTGVAFASFSPEHRDKANLHMGSNDDWLGALGQKIPRFDNRILNDCILIPRFHVCKAEIRQDAKTDKPIPDSLLPAEVTFLMKLKNTLVAGAKAQRKLTVEEIKRSLKWFQLTCNKSRQMPKIGPKKSHRVFL